MSDLALLLQAFEVIARSGMRLSQYASEMELNDGKLSDERRAELTAMTKQVEDDWFNGDFQEKL